MILKSFEVTEERKEKEKKKEKRRTNKKNNAGGIRDARFVPKATNMRVTVPRVFRHGFLNF